ncbi:acyl-CoA dehydrogenase [Rhodoferax lacus]|uniref:Acyl-CoA dehydrogenase n=1 Tax=Rhodoferax lacus TaxID=2184758 RepID=A0A3E1R6J5_9BURK|nr:acyl-CoA dehydrogenase family protein [Rhodoferax lacus]RFO94989.1 acyl-CoA dehydrogenase [Rhodoferax lacus]
MDLALSDEQQLIVDSAVAFLASSSTLAKVRVASETGDGCDRALWQEVAAMGWCGVHLPEDAGGLGLGLVELALLQEQLGRHLACIPFFDSVALAASLLRSLPGSAQTAALLGSLASGEQMLAVAMAQPDADLQWAACASANANANAIPSASASASARAIANGAGWLLSGYWPAVGSAHLADVLLLPAHTALGECLLFAMPADAQGLSLQPLQAVDATRRSANVRATDVQLPATACLARGPALDQAWQRARCLGAIALAAEQVGVAQACLDLTLAYTAQRVQFGKSIAGFQAVKHRCAQMLVALEQARSAVYGAAAVADTEPAAAVLLLHAAQARMEATQAALYCSREAIQLHGGMGFTWEFDPHLFLRRAQLASQRLGPVSWWCEQVAVQLLDEKPLAEAHP